MQHPTDFLPSGRPVGVRPEEAALEDFPIEERVLVTLARQAWASASNIAARLEVPDVRDACAQLEKDGSIAGREVGVTRRQTRRYVLSRQGVQHVTRPFRYKGSARAALPLTWQMTEEGVTRLLEWLPMIETLYEVLPIFWTGGMARPFQWQSPYPDPAHSNLLWLGVPTLVDIRWLPRGRLHVAVTWRFEHPDRPPQYYSLPFFWAGLLPQEDYRDRSLRLGPFIRSPRDPKSDIRWDINPPVAAIALDEFSAWRARGAYGDDVEVGAVDTTGALVWCAEASHSEWTLGERPPPARSIGNPEAAAVAEGPDIVNLGGVREYRLFCFLADCRGATKANFAHGFRMSNKAVTDAVDHLAERDVVTTVGRHLYVTVRGVQMLAARDRVDARRLVEVTHLDPEGEAAERERRHDAAVAEVAAEFLRAGYPVVAGWRWVVSWHDGQLVPDLWVRVPVPGREEGVWLPVELEFSARTRRRIEEEKLRSFRLAPARLGKPFPILVITGEEEAAKLFDDLAGNLIMLATTLRAFLTGVWEGPESVWRRAGRPVGLSDVASEPLAHLQQQTGRSVDRSAPSPEVWDRLLGKELVSSDPFAGDLGLALPPISPQLQAGMDCEPNQGRAGDSATTPPAAPPEPARKAAAARDRVLHEAPAASPANTNDPPSATTPPAARPEPGSRRVAPAQDPTRQRREVLTRINRMVEVADRIAGERVREGQTDVRSAENWCLMRVRAIITYGAAQHLGEGKDRSDGIADACLWLEETHRRELWSRNPLWWLTTSQKRTDPRAAFRALLKEYPNTRKEACKLFDGWARMVDRSVRKARKARRSGPGGESGGPAT